jgi:hypothetical protein
MRGLIPHSGDRVTRVRRIGQPPNFSFLPNSSLKDFVILVKKKNNQGGKLTAKSQKRAVSRTTLNRNTRAVNINLGPKQSAPDSVRLKMGYGQVVSLDLSTTGGAEHAFRLNSLFDPDFTGVGTQPVGFDQWSALYNRYRVHACKVHVEFISSGTTLGALCGVSIRRDSTVANQFQDLVGEPYCVWVGAGAAQAGPACIHTGASVREIYGIGNSTFMDEDYSASIGANPSRVVYGHIWCNTWTQTAEAISFRVAVHLIYDVEFYERVDLDDSFAIKQKLELLYNHLNTKPRPYFTKTIDSVSNKEPKSSDAPKVGDPSKLLNLRKAILDYQQE